MKHSGTRWNAGGNAAILQSSGPLPSWVLDPTCPYGQDVGSPLPNENIPSPASVPGSALAFDSFGRRNQTLAFQSSPTLGTTEGGSLGQLAWQQGVRTGSIALRPTKLWGILGGQAVFLDLVIAVAWVPVGVSDQDVRVTRNITSPWSAGNTGLAFRVQDKDNYWSLNWTHNLGVLNSGFGYLTLCKIVAGTATYPGGQVALPSGNTWDTIRVVAHGTTITAYTGSGTVWTQRIQLTGQTDNQLNMGAGLATMQLPSTYLDASARFKNFTVFAG